MRYLLRLPLTVQIPAILVVFSIFASIWVAADSLYRANISIEKEARYDIQNEMTFLQTAISDYLIKGDMEGGYRVLTTLSSQPDISALFVADENNMIIMSTRFEWTGMGASEIPSNYDPSIGISIKNSMQRNVRLTEDRRLVLGYFPVVLGLSKGDIRPSRVGVMFVEHDLTSLKALARLDAMESAVKLWLPFAAFIVALWWLLHMLITRRLTRLVSQTDRIAAGDLQARSNVEGSDEIALLGRTLNSMAESLAEGHMNLLAEISKKEEASEELQKFLRAIEHTADTVVITDTKGAIEYVNPMFSRNTGYSREEAIGQNPRILKSGDMPDEEYQKMWEKITSGHDWHGIFHNKRKDGTFYWESSAISPIKNEKGEITNFVAVKQDITDRILAEEELRKKERLTILGQVVGSVVHDLRNPLNTIQLAAEVLNINLPDAGKIPKDCIETIKSEVAECSGIISSLLGSVRTNVPQLKPVSGAELAEMSVKRCEIPDNIHLTLEFEPDIPFILIDPTQIRQVLVNIINNAIQAMPEGGGLRVGACKDGEFIKIFISDTGEGIPAENLEMLFQPLFTTKKDGTGLGLIIVKNLTEANGGKVEVYSEAGKGTTFSLSFPVRANNKEKNIL